MPLEVLELGLNPAIGAAAMERLQALVAARAAAAGAREEGAPTDELATGLFRVAVGP